MFGRLSIFLLDNLLRFDGHMYDVGSVGFQPAIYIVFYIFQPLSHTLAILVETEANRALMMDERLKRKLVERTS